MKVTLFARVNTKLNPYILLFKNALEQQGVHVHLERELGLIWLITAGRFCDIIHLHWIEAAYKPVALDIQSRFMHQVLNNRVVRAIRGILRFANFAAAFFLAKLGKKTIVYTVHNLKAHGELQWPFDLLHQMAHRLVLSSSDRIHVHNCYTHDVLKATYGRQNGVTVIPHGNYLGCYPNEISQLQARQQLGLPADGFIYLFLGLLRPYKGLETLISGFTQLKAPMGRLLIAGRVFRESYKDKLLHLIQDNSTIKLIPEFIPDEDLQLYMNACDVCVLPYKDLTTSGAAILALSFGRPLIAPAIASFPELITPETGVLYDPELPDALALALQEASEQPWSEKKVFDQVHQFDWQKLGPLLVSLYQNE